MAKNSAQQQFLSIALFLFLFIVLSGLGFFTPLTKPLTSVLFRIATPFYAAGAHVRRTLDAVFVHRDVQITASLPEQLEKLRIENARLKNLIAENESLKTALDFKEHSKDESILARVLSDTSDELFHGFFIDKGSNDGIEVGQPVIVGNGVIVGKVFETRSTSATVLVLYDSRSKLAVMVQNGVDTVGVLEGDRGLSMAINLIPQTEILTEGEVIVTSGIENGIPKGLVIGTLKKINKNTQDPFQSATVVPFQTTTHQPFVHVLRSTIILKNTR